MNRSTLSIYPPQNLSEHIAANPQYKKINLYIDLKNVMRFLYVESVVQEIVERSKQMKHVDSTIFQNILLAISWWRAFAFAIDLDIEFFICTDIGQSSYHKKLNPEYKKSREISNYQGYVYGDEIKQIRDRNLQLAEVICNRLPGVHFYCLRYLEADFLPYYLITRNYIDDHDTVHVICSNDKDNFQCFVIPDLYMVYRSKGEKHMVDKDTVLLKYMGVDKIDSSEGKINSYNWIKDFRLEYMPVIMAFVGDTTDDIPGVKGIGPKRAVKALARWDITDKLIGDLKEANQRVFNGGLLLIEDAVPLRELPSVWQTLIRENELITNSYKQVSYEQLCLWLEKRDDTNKIELLKYIDRITKKEGIEELVSSKPLFQSISKLQDLFIIAEDVTYLFPEEIKKEMQAEIEAFNY